MKSSKIVISLFVFLLFSNFSSSQNNLIEYKVLLNKSNQITLDMIKSYPDMEPNLKLVMFSLLYNENEMKFQISKTSKSINDDIGSSMLMTDIQGIYHRKNNSDDLYIEIDKYGEEENFIIKKKFITDWEITNERKDILGYNCTKATCVLKIDFGDNDVNTLYPISVWFTPQIKYAYGPKGYGNLPGLILELNENFVTYVASKISIDTLNQEIALPTNKKIITESKMYDLMEKSIKASVDKSQSDLKKGEIMKVKNNKL